MSLLKSRLTANRLNPVLCTFGINNSVVYGMRTVSDQAKNVQVRIRQSKALTTVSKDKVISKVQYHCQVERVTGTGMQKYFGTHELEYCLASVIKLLPCKVSFVSDLKTALLKLKIYGGQLIEVKSGAKSVYGVAY